MAVVEEGVGENRCLSCKWSRVFRLPFLLQNLESSGGPDLSLFGMAAAVRVLGWLVGGV